MKAERQVSKDEAQKERERLAIELAEEKARYAERAIAEGRRKQAEAARPRYSPLDWWKRR